MTPERPPSPNAQTFDQSILNAVISHQVKVCSNGHFKSFLPPHPHRPHVHVVQDLYITKTVSDTAILLERDTSLGEHT